MKELQCLKRGDFSKPTIVPVELSPEEEAIRSKLVGAIRAEKCIKPDFGRMYGCGKKLHPDDYDYDMYDDSEEDDDLDEKPIRIIYAHEPSDVWFQPIEKATLSHDLSTSSKPTGSSEVPSIPIMPPETTMCLSAPIMPPETTMCLPAPIMPTKTTMHLPAPMPPAVAPRFLGGLQMQDYPIFPVFSYASSNFNVHKIIKYKDESPTVPEVKDVSKK